MLTYLGGGVRLYSERKNVWLTVLTAGLILVIVVLVLHFSGMIGANQSSTPEERLIAIESQLHAPGDTTTQTVVSSNVPAAWTIKRQIAVMLNKGLSNQQILSQLETDYGPTVLANPPAKGFGAWAWVLPIVGALLAIGLGGFFVYQKSSLKPSEQGIEDRDKDDSSLLEEKEWRQYL